jgi:hypothetical protein
LPHSNNLDVFLKTKGTGHGYVNTARSVWNLLHPSSRRVIIHLGRTFQKLCTKVLNPSDIPNLKTYLVETLCMFEIWWPPTIFDLQTQLIIHLINELKMCGPMGS